MRTFFFFVAFGVAAVVALALAGVANAADINRGKLVYESRCVACHADSVHKRESRKAKEYDDIRAIVRARGEGTTRDWTAEDTEDVSRYLNERYYKFPCPAEVCPPTG